MVQRRLKHFYIPLNFGIIGVQGELLILVCCNSTRHTIEQFKGDYNCWKYKNFIHVLFPKWKPFFLRVHLWWINPLCLRLLRFLRCKSTEKEYHKQCVKISLHSVLQLKLSYKWKKNAVITFPYTNQVM